MKGQAFFKRLRYALCGLYVAFGREASLRFHALATAGVVATLAATRPSPLWWALGLLAIGLVIVAELLNTALETLSDHLHPERHPEIKAAKDIAAGAVLIASVVALAVAVAFCLR
jgi:diacylglycerol kinase (ATP)